MRKVAFDDLGELLSNCECVDLESEIVLSATIQEGTEPDSKTLLAAVADAQTNLIRSGSEAEIQDVAADTGYHANEQMTECDHFGIRTSIPELSPQSQVDRQERRDQTRGSQQSPSDETCQEPADAKAAQRES